jgi:hypothetical protein
MGKTQIFVALLFVVAFSSGCDVKGNRAEVSNDIVALHNLLQLDLPAKGARWEVFDTPEYTGGVPGPTDYVTLIAELELSHQKNVEWKSQMGKVCIAPNAARPWLAEGFRSMLATNRNDCTDLSNLPNCGKFQAKLKKDGKWTEGFLCNNSEKLLLYLTLADYSSG